MLHQGPCCNFEDFEEKMALTISVFPLYFFRISEKSLWCPSNQRRRGWRKSNKQPRRQRHQHQERTENRQQSSLVCPLLFCISFCISLCISFCICKYKRKGPSVWRWLQPSSDAAAKRCFIPTVRVFDIPRRNVSYPSYKYEGWLYVAD